MYFQTGIGKEVETYYFNERDRVNPALNRVFLVSTGLTMSGAPLSVRELKKVSATHLRYEDCTPEDLATLADGLPNTILGRAAQLVLNKASRKAA
jgi:hypothetical protein